MPVKTWKPPPERQDSGPQPSDARAAVPRRFDSPIGSADAIHDAAAPVDDLSAYGNEPINTHGSER